MMRFVDTSFRRRCGSVIIQGPKGFMKFLGLRERGGDSAYFFGSAVISFLREGSLKRKKAAKE